MDLYPATGPHRVHISICVLKSRLCLILVVYFRDVLGLLHHPLSRVVKAKAGSSHILTWTAWVQFPPPPTHNTCLLCSAMSGLMKLAAWDSFQFTIFRDVRSKHLSENEAIDVEAAGLGYLMYANKFFTLVHLGSANVNGVISASLRVSCQCLVLPSIHLWILV